MDLDGITLETLAAVVKAQTSGVTNTTGLFGVDLTGLVSQVPVVTPFRNSLPRVGAPEGAKSTTWRALLNINNQQANPFVAFDAAGSLTLLDEQDVFAQYAPLELVGLVTQDSIDLAKNYADARALVTLQTLNQLMIGEDKALIGAQNYALATPGTPTVTYTTTGGSIAASTAIPVKVSARTGMNYFYGGAGVASAAGTVTTASTTSTNTGTATVTSVPGAVAYDWYVNSLYYTTTIVNTVTITSIPTAAQAAPTNLPLLSTATPASAPPTADGTAGSNQFNGLIATITGDYGATGLVTHGTGTLSGSTITSLDGSTLTLSGGAISQIDTLFLNIWNSVYMSPTALMMNAQQANDISVKVGANPQTVTFQSPTDSAGRSNMIAGGFVGIYKNKAAGGVDVRIEVHPSVPPGTIIARSDSVPLPGANIDHVLSVRTLRDYSSFEYPASRLPSSGPTGPRSEIGVRCIETLVNRAPVCFGVLQNVAAG